MTNGCKTFNGSGKFFPRRRPGRGFGDSVGQCGLPASPWGPALIAQGRRGAGLSWLWSPRDGGGGWGRRWPRPHPGAARAQWVAAACHAPTARNSTAERGQDPHPDPPPQQRGRETSAVSFPLPLLRGVRRRTCRTAPARRSVVGAWGNRPRCTWLRAHDRTPPAAAGPGATDRRRGLSWARWPAAGGQAAGPPRLRAPGPAPRRRRESATAPPPAQYMCWPPLIDSVEPVTNSASSAVRKATPRAMSSALPSRPIGMRATIFSSTSAGTARTISVST